MRSWADVRAGLLRSWLVWCLVAAVAVRLPFLAAPVGPDEGGLLLVGGSWGDGGDSLYGPYWVDRPPLIIAIHELAERTGGAVSLRLIGCLAVVATIWAAWATGRVVAGHAGARWAAVIAMAVVSAPTIGSPQVSGELLAVPFVLGAVALTLRAVSDRAAAPVWMAAVAGALAACGPLLKQNLFDGLLAIVSIVLVAAVLRQVPRRRLVTVTLVAIVSAVATTALVLGWSAWRGTGVLELWQGVVLFRADATSVLSAEATDATRSRFLLLTLIFAVGGPLALTLLALRTARRAPSPGAVTAVVLLLWATVSIVAGGSYWAHYLVQLAPGLSLAVAAALASDRRGSRAARLVTACTVTAAMVCAVFGLGIDRIPSTDREVAGRYLATMTRPGDTAVVAWGHPSILHEAEVQSPYEQLWSLPVRVHDPDLGDFVGVLEGPRAPDWVISRGPTLDSWGIDASRADEVVEARYETVAEVCGYRVLARRGTEHRLPSPREAERLGVSICPSGSPGADGGVTSR